MSTPTKPPSKDTSTGRAEVTAITANLVVDRIEDCLPFWVQRLGFEIAVEVPHEDTIGFVILKHGAAQIMLQSRASMEKDVAALASDTYKTAIYVSVTSLAPIRRALEGYPTIIPERTTFYGAREIFVRDPAGNPVAFAEHTD